MVQNFKMGDLNCSSECLKITLIIFNTIIFIFGLVIAGFAGFEAFKVHSKLHTLLQSHQVPQLNNGLYILFAVGLMLAVIAIIGMWGTLAENTCLLFVYFLVLFILFILELTGTIIIFVEFQKVETQIIKNLGKPPSIASDSSDMITDMVVDVGVQFFEKKYHCCGITGPQNYGANPIPSSCYNSDAVHLLQARSLRNIRDTSDEFEEDNESNAVISSPTTTTRSPDEPYQQGCIKVAQPYLYAAGGTAISIMLLELLAIIFTCCLMSSLKDQYESIA